MSLEAFMEEMRVSNEKFTSYYNSGDMKAVSELYTEDCKAMPQGKEVQEGRKAVEAMFRDMYNAGAKSITVKLEEVGPLGSSKTPLGSTDIVFERTSYTFYKEDGSVYFNGKYVVIRKKVAGKWYFYIDIMNSNTPV